MNLLPIEICCRSRYSGYFVGSIFELKELYSGYTRSRILIYIKIYGYQNFRKSFRGAI